MTPQLRISVVTHRGAIRDHNEDSAGVGGWLLRGEVPDPWVTLREAPVDVLVADGLGGHRGGATASSIAVEAFFAAVEEPGPSIIAADRAIHERADGDPRLGGMGSTLVGVRIEADGRANCFSVGDSRAYRLADGYLSPLTTDHRIEVAGITTLTQALGGNERTTLVPDQLDFVLRPHDRLLLCTDGVHDVLEDHVIADLIRDGSVTALRDAVLAAAAPDNLTYAVIEVLSAP